MPVVGGTVFASPAKWEGKRLVLVFLLVKQRLWGQNALSIFV
jgi:hypothetical protein